MLTLLLMPLALCPAARAGSWQFSCTGSGKETFTAPGRSENNAWIPPSPAAASNYPYQVSGLSCPSSGGGYTSVGTGDVWAGNISIQATVTLTWTHGTGQTDANDPAPPSVMLIEGSSASWTAQVYNSQAVYAAGTGKADDGLKDAEVDHSAYGAEQGGVSTTAGAAKTSALPPHWTSYAVSGDVLTLPTRTLAASASFTSPAGGGAADFACSVGTYSIQIHAQPYGFTQATGSVYGTSGALQFTYNWLSTSGNLNDLSSCYFHEHVSYPGGNPYTPPAPFDGTKSYDNPTVYPGTGANGYVMTGGVIGDIQYPWASPGFRSSYSSLTIPAPQRYEFDDTATGEANVLVPGPDSTATITRSITNNRPPYLSTVWWYTCTKNNVTSWVQLN